MDLADPERALAVSYAPVDARAALSTLFALDERLGAVVAGAREPGIGLIRLAWWREALTALDEGRVPPEPLLAAIARDVLPRGVAGAALAEIEEGWALLLDDAADADAIARYGAARGGRLFALAGAVLGAGEADRLERAGTIWALADLAHRHSQAAVRDTARRLAREYLRSPPTRRWPAPARPLGALAVLAARDVGAETPRQQGGPSRVARMLALRLTGR